VIPLDDGSFGVEVTVSESNPATVRKFATEADAEGWIEDRRRVQTQSQSGRWFTRSRGPQE
jgi:hypothetical protein